jgi:hypothetical protein
MRSVFFRGILAAVALLTAACSSPDSVAPTATPASARLSVNAGAAGLTTTSRSIDQYVWISCGNGGAGETFHVTGQLRYNVESTKDASGVYHLNIKSNTSGLTAVGLTSGSFFRGLMTERINSRAEDYLNMNVRTAEIIRFVAPASGGSVSLMVSSHFIVDQGTYVLWEQSWDEVCR